MNLKLMNLTTENDCLYMNGERHILISSSAFGELRKDLIDNIGLERMKGFLLRYGWELGQQDAQKVQNENIQDIREMTMLGPTLHTKKGHAFVEDVHLEIDTTNGNKFIEMSGKWRASYEAEQHVRLFGIVDYEVCFTLVGYASGYVSKLFNEMIVFKEITCKGKGDDICRWIGRPVDAWEDKAEDFLKSFEETPIILELEDTYDQLLQERNNLEKTAEVQKRLTEEIIKGNDLNGVSNVVSEIVQVPLLIEDVHFRPIAYSPCLEEGYEEIKEKFNEYIQAHKNQGDKKKLAKSLFQQTKYVRLDGYNRLITPFYLQGEIYGYCSFIYQNDNEYTEVAETILERISSVCSIYLLNEKAKVDTLERMKGRFLEELINDQYESKNEIIQRGNYLHLNLENPYYFVIIKYKIFSDSISDKLDFHKHIVEEVTEYWNNIGVTVLIGQRTSVNHIDLLIPIENLEDGSIEKTISKIVEHLKEKFPLAQFSAGISERADDIKKVPEYFRQAEAAVRLATFKGDITTFESIGIVGSLINENNLDKILKSAEYELRPLYNENEETCHETLKTLYYFLINGGNLEQTALDLSLSVSGLRYRIRRIEDRLEKDLRNPLENYQLLLSLQSLILIGKLDWE